MGNRQMPTVADFLTIEKVTPELVLEIGYLPQCSFCDQKPGSKHCWQQSEWTIDGNHHCTFHKDAIVQMWEQSIAEWTERPAQAQDSDLELLEIVRDELDLADQRKTRPYHLYPGNAVGRVIKDLSLPDNAEGQSLAAWYLWEMEIFSIHQRVMFFEDATN